MSLSAKQTFASTNTFQRIFRERMILHIKEYFISSCISYQVVFCTRRNILHIKEYFAGQEIILYIKKYFPYQRIYCISRNILHITIKEDEDEGTLKED